MDTQQMTDAQTPRTVDQLLEHLRGDPPVSLSDSDAMEIVEYARNLQRELAAVRGQLEESAKTGLKYMAQAAEETRKAELAESELAAAKAENQRLMGDFSILYAERRKMLSEVNSLKEALKKYGEHDVGCALLGTHEPCSCGLDNILDAISKE